MEMHIIQELPALLFDNIQKTLKKLVWKHMKFYIMTHYITSSTACKIFTMNCQNTSVKCKKSSSKCIIYSKICKKFSKLQRKFVESMHTTDEKLIQPFFHLNTSKTCQNQEILYQ